jgi:anti-anti-sigma factor
MYCEQRKRNHFTIIECFGRFDESDSNMFLQLLENLNSQGSRNIILNLTPVFFLDPGAINLLIFAKEFFNSHGGDVCIVSPLSSVQNELIRSKVTENIATFGTLYDAIHRPHAAYSEVGQVYQDFAGTKG